MNATAIRVFMQLSFGDRSNRRVGVQGAHQRNIDDERAPTHARPRAITACCGIDAAAYARLGRARRDAARSIAAPVTTIPAETRCASVNGPRMRTLTRMNSIANRMAPASTK